MADVAELVFEIDSSRARTAVTDLAKMQNAATKLASEWSKTDGVIRKSNGQFASSIDVSSRYGDEIRRLAREFNPALNAVYEFQQAEERLNRAVALGVITVDQQAVALTRVKTQLASATTAQVKFGQASQVAGHHAQNLGYQINDIGMMMALGQNPFALMMQQGPQVAQIFSQMNAEGRKIGPTLISAFKGMLNPITAVTLAVIGGVAALTQWITKASEVDLQAEKTAERLTAAYSSITDAIAATQSKIDQLRYGVDEGYQVELLQEQLRIRREIETAVREGNAQIQAATGNVDRQRLIYNDVNAKVKTLSDKYMENNKLLSDQSNRATQLAIDQGRIAQAAGESAARTRDATAATDAWQAKMRGVLSYINAISATLGTLGGGAIQLAAIKTETDLLKKGVSLRDAGYAAAKQTQELEGDRRTKQLETQYGFMGKILGIAEKNQAATVMTAQNALDLEREAARQRESAAKVGGGGGGGGAAMKAAEKGFQSLQELLQKESMFQTAEYEKRQAQLETALNKKLITEKTYQDLRAQLQMVYFGSEYEKNQVQYQMDLDALNAAHDQKLLSEEQYQLKLAQLRWKHADELQSGENNRLSVELNGMANGFAQMNELAGGGYDQLLRAQKIFSAASALMSTYTGAAKALELPFPQNLIAMGKVLAAGFGLVSAIKGGGGKGGSGGGAASTATSAAATTKTEPTKNILVNLTGPDFLVDMAESIIQQIYDQSKDGRVIVSRG